jgi:hypothetical protein
MASTPPSSSTVLDQAEKLVLVQIVGDFAIGKVAELVGMRQVIDRDDVGNTALVERLDQVCADKSAGAGDDVVHNFPQLPISSGQSPL